MTIHQFSQPTRLFDLGVDVGENRRRPTVFDEHIHDPEYPPPGITPALVEAKVEITELMGNEVNCFFSTENADFMGRFDPRTKVSVGMTKAAAFDMSRIHLFDKQTEKAVR